MRGSLKSEFDLVAKNDIPNSLVINRNKFVAIMTRLMSLDPNDTRDCNPKKIPYSFLLLYILQKDRHYYARDHVMIVIIFYNSHNSPVFYCCLDILSEIHKINSFSQLRGLRGVCKFCSVNQKPLREDTMRDFFFRINFLYCDFFNVCNQSNVHH